ncbi:MAG: transcriptional regulator [Rhizobiaceae bacterium]|nr:transcriptional regulator [Rhizobiaceae bacterium]
MNDNEAPVVWILIGRVTRRKGSEESEVHVLLQAPDEDTAVRLTLNGLQSEGFAEVQLDQIGEMEGEPDEEPYISAYQGALEGEVAIVVA